MNWRLHSAQAVVALGIFAPASAQANIGLPMIALFLPPLWIALVPIVLLEALLIAKGKGISFKTSIGGTAIANVASTIVGVPLLWFLLATIELICCGTALGLGSAWTKLYAVTVQAPWLIPYESEFGWMIPAALCTLAVVFIVMSVAVEAPIVSRVTKLPLSHVWRPMWFANVASYTALALAGAAIAVSDAKLDVLHQAFMPLSEAMVEAVFSIASALAKGEP
jgi:hypothetical protein